MTNSQPKTGVLTLLSDKEGTNAIYVHGDTVGKTTTLSIDHVEIQLVDTSETWTPNTIHAVADDGAQAVVNIMDESVINIAAEYNAAVSAGKNAVLNMSGGTINVAGGHCGSGIYSYGKNNHSTINVTGGTFNITADASESTSGYNAGIEAAGTCSLTVTAAHFNVSAKGGTLGAAVMLGRDVDAEFGTGVTIDVYQSVWKGNWSITDHNTDIDITQKGFAHNAKLINNATIIRHK